MCHCCEAPTLLVGGALLHIARDVMQSSYIVVVVI